LKRKITAILAADIAEYSRLIAEDEEETLTRLESYRRVFDDFVTRAGGRIFNTSGDGVMCEFPSAVEGTRCAIDIQESLRTRNLAYPQSRQMHFRIGVSIGDVVERDGDLLGDGVNVAARLQTLAEPGGICVSRNVQEAVASKISVPFRDLGEREVKNLPHPVHAYRIEMGVSVPRGAQSSQQKRASSGTPSPLAPALWMGAGLLIAGGGAALYWLGRNDTARLPPPVIQLQTQAPQQAPSTPPEPAARPGASLVVTENLTPAQAFEKLAKAGGLVRDAASAPELYHNARSYEARGESANARRDYLEFAKLGNDFIDPLLRLAALIRAQDGRSGAREVFGELSRGKGRAAGLVQILQFEGIEKLTRLTAFAEANPDFAPVHALIAIELGEEKQGTQTIDEKRRELAALARFLGAEREGRLVSFFLDQSVLAQWLERAQKREAQAKAFFALKRDRIGTQFMRSNSGWMAALALPEAATEIEFKLDSGEFRSTGLLQNIDTRTGRPMANPAFELPLQQGPTEIALRYRDAQGTVSPVTIVPFDPAVALVSGMRDILERFSNAWLAFGQGHNGQLLYFTHLVSYRCAISKAEIGFNGEAPSQPLPLPPCDQANPYGVPNSATPYLRLAPDTQSATIRLTFIGGETSEVKTFQRPK